jgi:hypothetical protein
MLSLFLKSPLQTPVRTCSVPHSCHMSCPSLYFLFYHPN